MEGQRPHRHRRDNPSFSSTLLDSIYRSIDQGEPLHNTSFRSEEQHMPSFRLPVDKKLILRRKSMEDFDSGFSSSESGSTWTSSSVKSNPPPCYNYASQRPKSTRNSYNSMDLQQRQGGGFVKTKSRALKIYTDLKKVKQPISPGGRLANFLNSIFTSVNAKKPKIDNSDRKRSSVSRPCLSKTPSSQEKATKRSVRFCPVSVIVGEDCRHKNLHQEDLKFSHVLEEKRRVQEAAQDLLKNYRQIQNQTLSDADDDASWPSSGSCARSSQELSSDSESNT